VTETSADDLCLDAEALVERARARAA